jgi:hypothetical protein
LIWATATGEGLTLAAGTATTAVSALNISQTLNNAGVTFAPVKISITETAFASGTLLFQVLGGAAGTTSVFKILNQTNGGDATFFGAVTGARFTSAGYLQANQGLFVVTDSNTGYVMGSGNDVNMTRGGANQWVFGSGTSGAGTTKSRAEINKLVTGIADNAATATLTGTIPNGNHSAGGKIIFKGAAGAGGAIGSDEFSAEIEYDWVVTRTTGANAVVTLSAALLTAITASVAGGATPTISAAVSAVSGAVGATNTFTFNVTIHAITGSSTNHTCFVYLTSLNDNASGFTVA